MYKREKKAALGGVTLVETLVALALLGVVMIPVLFASSAFFTSRLAGVRDRLGVSHDVSVFLNRFMEEMYYTQFLIETSDADELHFAYIDPITQESVQAGYKLEAPTDGAGNLVLKRLHYNGGAWVETTPYAVMDPQEIRLPSNAAFRYCDEPTCATPVTAKKALFVRLENFAFASPGGGYDLEMPTTLDVYLAGSTAGGVVLSESARALYSFDGSDNYGAGANLGLASLSATGQRLHLMNTLSSGGSGSLSVILSSGDFYDHTSSIIATPGGRVYFAEHKTSSAKVWTWKENTGLSVLISNGATPMMQYGTTHTYSPRAVLDSNGGMLWGECDGTEPIRYWSESTGLSVILASSTEAGWESLAVDTNGRFYIGGDDSGGATRFWSWKPGVGLSTIIANKVGIGSGATRAFPGGGGVFGGWSANTNIYKWTEGDGLTTIMGGSDLGAFSLQVADDGRVVFAKGTGGNDQVWTWKSGVLSTILSTNSVYPGFRSMHITSDGNTVFFGQQSNSGKFWVWQNTGGAGTLSVLASGINRPGAEHASLLAPDGRIFFGHADSGVPMRTWKASTGLSLLAPTGKCCYGQRRTLAYSNSAQRFFYTSLSGTGDIVYTWHETDGLSVLGTVAANAGMFETTTDGRVFFGSDSATSPYWTWKKETGLTTILSSGKSPGMNGMHAYSATAERLFFIENNATGKVYTWGESPPTGMVLPATNTGIPTGQALTMTMERNPTYTASVQDSTNGIYFLDNTTKTIDRYSYNGSGNAYTLMSTLNWTGNATTVAAIAVDSSSDAIALLDAGNTEIDVYANRKLSGAVAPSSTLDLNAANTNPTGLAFSNRTGNYLVIDSNQSANTIRLFVYSNAGTLLHTIDIDLTASNLGVAATAETSFKIAYDSQRNLLYLIAPTVDRVYALSLPKVL